MEAGNVHIKEQAKKEMALAVEAEARALPKAIGAPNGKGAGKKGKNTGQAARDTLPVGHPPDTRAAIARYEAAF